MRSKYYPYPNLSPYRRKEYKEEFNTSPNLYLVLTSKIVVQALLSQLSLQEREYKEKNKCKTFYFIEKFI
jgi:hypothetical protein